VNESYQNPDSRKPHAEILSARHRRMLEEGSAIGPAEIAASGARTIKRGRDLPHEYSDRQRRRTPGVLFIGRRPNGQTTYIFRPDVVDPTNPGHKYELPCKSRGAPGNTLDVPPSLHHLIADTDVPLIVAEGTKKMLSVTTAARREGATVLVVGISGCWNWMADGKPISDMFDVPVEGRSVTVMFDSDMLRKIEVQEAAKALAEHLEGRGARVFITYFRDAEDGSKVGADDFFVAGGTFAELRLLTRRYNPEDFKLVRLSRDDRLRAMTEDLWGRYIGMPAATVGECSDRASMRELMRRAPAGKVTDKGIIVRAPIRPMCIKTRLGRQGQSNSLKRLEKSGYIERINEPKRKVEKKGTAYLLYAECTERALSGHYERERHSHGETHEDTTEAEPLRNAELYAGVHSARASTGEVPELRHSKVIHTWARRNGRRVVVDSQYVYRLAKPRQEVLMYMVDAGGEATEAELLERFGSKSTRPRDFHRRKIEPLTGWRYSRDKETGKERRLEVGPPIVAVEDGTVRILPEWRAMLEEHRRHSGELEDNERQAQRMRDQSKAYRNRDRTPAGVEGELRGKEEVARLVEERRREDRQRWVEEQRQKVGETAATFLADELDGAQAVRFKEILERWQLRSTRGSVEELRKAVLYGPWRFVRESDGDLYICREDTRGADGEARSTTPKPKMPKQASGVYQHGQECGCDWCVA
jgi:hypothetical protein